MTHFFELRREEVSSLLNSLTRLIKKKTAEKLAFLQKKCYFCIALLLLDRRKDVFFVHYCHRAATPGGCNP